MKLKPLERLIIWKLMLLGDGLKMKELPNSFTAAMRKRLVDAGLINVVQQGRAKVVYVNEEQAWHWAGENLAAELSRTAQFGGPILQEVLTRLNRYLVNTDSALAELLAPLPEKKEKPDDLESIKRAYLNITDGEWNARVRIAELKKQLPGVNQTDFTASLKQLQEAGEIDLYTHDDPLEANEEDKRHAVRLFGEAFTLIYMRG